MKKIHHSSHSIIAHWQLSLYCRLSHSVCNWFYFLQLKSQLKIHHNHLPWGSFLYRHSISHSIPLQRRHNERDCVSNHQPYNCFLNRLFRRISKKTSRLQVTGLFKGNSPVTRNCFSGTGNCCLSAGKVTMNDMGEFDHRLILTPAWRSNYIHYKLWDEII